MFRARTRSQGTQSDTTSFVSYAFRADKFRVRGCAAADYCRHRSRTKGLTKVTLRPIRDGHPSAQSGIEGAKSFLSCSYAKSVTRKRVRISTQSAGAMNCSAEFQPAALSASADGREHNTLTARVLEFWFGAEQVKRDWYHTYEDRKAFWYNGGVDVDDAVRKQFGTDVEAAVAGKLDAHAHSGAADDILALIILLDQMTRNAYRGTARAFSGDTRAVALARRAVVDDIPDLSKVVPARLTFFIMPLMHSETLEDQNLCVQAVDRLIARLELLGTEADESRKAALITRQDAVDHRDIIQRFGRFPHRNHVLGRSSTETELVYLEQANRYGQ